MGLQTHVLSGLTVKEAPVHGKFLRGQTVPGHFVPVLQKQQEMKRENRILLKNPTLDGPAVLFQFSELDFNLTRTSSQSQCEPAPHLVQVVLQTLDVKAAHLQVAVPGNDNDSERRRCRDTNISLRITAETRLKVGQREPKFQLNSDLV